MGNRIINEELLEKVTGGFVPEYEKDNYRILANTDCEHHWYCPKYDIKHDINTCYPVEWFIEDQDVGRIIHPSTNS